MNRKATELAHAQPGQHIYAYCHVRTNQVLYSLDRFLTHSHLKQLPDLGANHTPPSIRKDAWRPLWSVTLPSTPNGRSQGLHAFKKLREWRKLHETCWEPSPQISRLYSEKEIEKMQAKLDDRGGSKKESVYDIIKRQKHNMRVQAVMDQKANSVADLAAVLIEQESLGVKTIQLREKKEKKAKVDATEEMLRLAEDANNGELKRIAEQIKAVTTELKRGAEGQKKKLRREREWLRRKQDKMIFARDGVALAKEMARGGGIYWERLAEVDESKRKAQIEETQMRIEELKSQLQKTTEATEQRSDIEAPMSDKIKAETTQTQDAKVARLHQELAALEEDNKHILFVTDQREKGLDAAQISLAAHTAGLKAKSSTEKSPSEVGVEHAESAMANLVTSQQNQPLSSKAEADFLKYLPAWPDWYDPVRQAENKELPKRGWIKQEIKRRNSPIFTAQGITVRWADLLDAEFAEVWPEDVKHERMESSRRTQYTHPAPEEFYQTLEATTTEEADALNDADIAEAAAEVEKIAEESEAGATTKTMSRNPQEMLEKMRDDILKTVRQKAKLEKKDWSWKLDQEVRKAKSSAEKARKSISCASGGAAEANALPEAFKFEGAEERTSSI